MRSISFRTILVIAAVGFFALGVVTTLARPRPPGPSGPATPASLATRTDRPSVNAPQITFLILGVDVLGSEGELLAAWIASFRPPGKELFLFGFPTDRPLPGGLTLREAYAESPDDAQVLTPLTTLPVDAVVVLDAEGFATVIDFLGGVPTGEATVEGAAALNVLALLRDEPSASLLAQARLLEALSARADRVQPGTDLQPILDLVPDHASVSVPPRDLLTAVAQYLPFDAERIHVSLPRVPVEPED
jgi:hypothetical protein